jgi:hypothetical protein
VKKMIIVKYDSEILGHNTFWVGAESDIEEIRNIPARMLAKKVVEDGVTRTSGMWTVAKVLDVQGDI